MPTIAPRSALIDFARLSHLFSSTTISPDNDQADYIRQETAIRLKLFELLRTDPHISSILFSNPYEEEGRYSVYDCFIVSANTEYFLEGKERSYRSTRFDDWFIEDEKAHELEELARRTKIPALWANLTTDGVCFVWNVRAPFWRSKKELDRKTFEKELGKKEKPLRNYAAADAIRLEQ